MIRLDIDPFRTTNILKVFINSNIEFRFICSYISTQGKVKNLIVSQVFVSLHLRRKFYPNNI